MQILPPKCDLPVDALALIESIGTINQRLEPHNQNNQNNQIKEGLEEDVLVDDGLTAAFQVWYRLAGDEWKMQNVGEQLIEDWLIQAISADELILFYEGEIDQRCQDSKTVREYKLLI